MPCQDQRKFAYLFFKYCAFADGTMFDTREYSGSIDSGSDHNPMFDPGKLELTSSHFKEMGRLETLEFIECSFSVSDTEKPQILKTLLEEMKSEKNLEYIYTIKLDLDSLEGALRKITPATINGRHLYRARFIGVSEESAMKACARLRARNQPCTIIGPGA